MRYREQSAAADPQASATDSRQHRVERNGFDRGPRMGSNLFQGTTAAA
jgi:hypothetical protein